MKTRQTERPGHDLVGRRLGGFVVYSPHPNPLPEGEGTKEAGNDVNRFRPAEADDPPRRAAGRRGDGGNGVIEGKHSGLLIADC